MTSTEDVTIAGLVGHAEIIYSIVYGSRNRLCGHDRFLEVASAGITTIHIKLLTHASFVFIITRPSQTADEITDNADDKLSDCVLRNNDHVLHELLSKRVDIT